jgi:large subunit ribosomal protein L25
MTPKEKFTIKAQTRDIKTTNLGKLRKTGILPAVLYGHNVKNQNLSISLGEFEKVLKKAGESTIVEIETEDGKKHPVLIHDIQRHYLTSKPEHVDFYEVSMTEKLKSKVALEYIGEAKAVKELGGVLVRILNEIEVECLPIDLPHAITVNICALNSFEDSIHIKDLNIPSNVKVLMGNDETVAKVQPPRQEEEIAEKPVEDISKVEGAAETKPETAQEGKEPAKAEAKTEAKTESKEKK